MEKIKEIIKDNKLYMFLAISLIFFGMFLKTGYTVDSYLFFQETWREPFFHLLTLGRIVTALFWLILSKTNYYTLSLISFIIAIICTTVSMYELEKLIKEEIKNQKISIIASILIIINICTLELFMFVEKGIMMLSVMMVILALKQLKKALKGDKKAILIILIEMFIANSCYQGTVGLFVALASIIIIINTKNIKDFIKNNIIVALLYGIPAILNVMMVKFIFHCSRVQGNVINLDKITTIIKNTHNIMINSYGIIPKYLIISLIGLISIIYIINVCKNKNSKAIKIVNVLYLLYVIAAVIIATVAPQILQSFVYMVPRNTFAIGSIIGILLFLLYTKNNVNKLITNILITIMIFFIIIQLYNFIDITLGYFYTNKKDEEIAKRIQEIIIDYEKETNKEVNKVVIYNYDTPTNYEGTRYNGDATVKAFAADWGIRGILDKTLNRDFKIINEKNLEYDEKFKNIENKNFDDEKIIINDDTLHLCIK